MMVIVLRKLFKTTALSGTTLVVLNTTYNFIEQRRERHHVKKILLLPPQSSPDEAWNIPSFQKPSVLSVTNQQMYLCTMFQHLASANVPENVPSGQTGQI